MNLTSHPNALIGGAGGGGALGYGVLTLLGEFGVHLSSKQSGLVTAACAIGVLLLAGPLKYIWAHGTSGTLSRIKHGAPAPPTGEAPPPPVA